MTMPCIDEIENFSNFKSILNSFDEIIGIIDTEYNMVFENHKAIEIYGESLGRKCYTVYGQQKTICSNCPTEQVFKTQKKAISEQISYDEKGTERIVEIIATPLKNKSGEVVAVLEVARDVTERKKAEKEKEILIKDLQDALAEIKILQGILPICSFCKKIRDDQGVWNQIEHYIHEHSEVQFSHGVCAECAEKHYPEFLK